MWHQLWIPILIPTLIIKSNCDDNNTMNTVFVHYGGHSDAEYQEQKISAAPTTIGARTTVKAIEAPTTVKFFEGVTDDDVVFVPNEATPTTGEDDEHGLRIKDIMMMKSVNDALNKDFHVDKAVDTPNEDIVFISGKNHDLQKSEPEDTMKRRNDNKYNIQQNLEDTRMQKEKLNCNNLDCNNTIDSVCGAKMLNRELKYRLFLNDCYFRKVNCGFKYEINRYQQVDFDKCAKIGAHYLERPFFFKPKPLYKPEVKPDLETRRSSSSRRSMTTNYNGEFCSHPCPLTCPDDYDPQCAISGTGQRRVFANHCKLDLNSCSYSVVWHKRPLAECVGGKKADMRQNRGFIGWMQRVGIVDRKGRLVLE